MKISKPMLGGVAFVIALIALFALRHRSLEKPRDHTEQTFHQAPTSGRQSLTVAFLPVTCHLTCPVTDYVSKTSTTGTEFDAQRFADFPTISEALKSKKLMAAFVTVPLAMKMCEQGAPIRIVCLGHRDGSELTIQKDSTARSIRDLAGKTIAIPSLFSNENFFMHKLLLDNGMTPKDLNFVVLPPPDMTAALSAKSIDGFIVAEPFCGKAEMDGFGRVLYFAKDVWPNYISCCLVVRQELIRDNPDQVRDLVRGITESGEWADKNRQDAAKLVSPYFHQNVKLLNYVLTTQPTRMYFHDLDPTDAELQKIQDMGLSLGFLKKKVPMSDIIDRSFFPEHSEPAKVDLARMSEIIKPEGGPR